MYIVYCSADIYDTYTKYNPVDVRWDVLNHTMSQYNLHYNHILWLNCVMEVLQLLKYSLWYGHNLNFMEGLDWDDELEEMESAHKAQLRTLEDLDSFIARITLTHPLNLSQSLMLNWTCHRYYYIACFCYIVPLILCYTTEQVSFASTCCWITTLVLASWLKS